VESVLNVKIHRLDAKSRNEEDLEEMYKMSKSGFSFGEASRNSTFEMTNSFVRGSGNALNRNPSLVRSSGNLSVVRSSGVVSMNPVHDLTST
jgi:hypothetical protein